MSIAQLTQIISFDPDFEKTKTKKTILLKDNYLDAGSHFRTITHLIVFGSSQSVLLTLGSVEGRWRGCG